MITELTQLTQDEIDYLLGFARCERLSRDQLEEAQILLPLLTADQLTSLNETEVSAIETIEKLIDLNQQSNQPQSLSPYERKRIKEAEKQRKLSAAAREISDQIHELTSDQIVQKAECVGSLKRFCEMCFTQRFSINWSEDHLSVINDIERIVTTGGLLAVAMPRGTGKTSLLEVAIIWSLFRGTHKFAVLLGATAEAATDLLKSIKDELCDNDKLAELWPEICVPLRALEDVNQRRVLLNGERIRMRITSRSINLPHIPENPAAGSVLRVAGILSRIRGMKHRLSDGTVIRPKLVLGDDLQTDESARRRKDVERREKTIKKAVLGLAGPRQKISAMLALTVIQPDDLADRLLDRQRHPEWNGRRTKLMYALPTNLDLWGQYAEIYKKGLRAGDGGKSATEFYSQNRSEMDAGAIVAWPERYEPGELSAVENAMRIRINDPVSFSAEYQNDPIPEDETTDKSLTVEAIVKRTVGVKRGVVPMGCEHIGAGIDVQGGALYWTIVAAEPNATPAIIDYGVWPEQRRTWFRLKDITNTFKTKFPNMDESAQIYNAIKTITEQLCERRFFREDGAEFEITSILIDAGWNTNTVRKAVEQSKYRTKLHPAFGRDKRKNPHYFLRPAKPGEIVRHDYRIPPLDRGRKNRHVLVDSDAWISRLTDAFKIPLGSTGAATLFEHTVADGHLMFAEHLTAEYSIEVIVNGIKRREWAIKPGETENHFLDSTKLACVATCISGADPDRKTGLQGTKKKKSPRVAAI